LLSLLAFVGLHPLMLGGTAARLAGGTILAIVLVAGTMAASRSTTHRAISAVLAVSALGLHFASLISRNIVVEAILMVVFSAFCLYTAIVMLRRVLSFGPLYADRVHAALSVYILLAMFWAGGYALIERVSPGAFSFPSGSVESLETRRTIHLLAAHVSPEHGDTDVDGIWRHHSNRAFRAFAGSVGAADRHLLYRGADLTAGWAISRLGQEWTMSARRLP
jgi:hypothetical protein